jgi:head-tail adaptor
MSASTRNRLVVIEHASIDTTDNGDEVETWAEWCSEYAEVNFGTGRERRQAAQEQASVPATFKVLDNSKTRVVGPSGYRIRYDGVWDIISAVPSREFNKEIHISAVKLAG